MAKGQRTYSQEEKDGVLLAVALNGGTGSIKPTAARLGMPRETVAGQWNRYLDEAHALTSSHKEGQTLADRFLAIAIAAQNRVMELLGEEKSAYRAALIEGINFDKWALITGRPTSRTEILKARYVEPEALRRTASAVIDVPARPARRRRKTA